MKNSIVLSVFDGHGGKILAEYCSSNIVEMLDAILLKKLKNRSDKDNIESIIVEAMKEAYVKL